MKVILSICKKCPQFFQEKVGGDIPRFAYCEKNKKRHPHYRAATFNDPIAYGKDVLNDSSIPENCDFKLEYLMIEGKDDAP